MPELPDITVHRFAMERFVSGRTVEQVAVRSLNATGLCYSGLGGWLFGDDRVGG